MKFYPRLGIYKASNVTVNPTTLESVSYAWWTFSRMVDGVLIFNLGTYSNTTTRHQQKALRIIREHHGEPDLFVFTRRCLYRSTPLEIARDTAYEYARDLVARRHERKPRDISWRAEKALHAVQRLAPLQYLDLLREAEAQATTERRERLDAAKARRASKRLQESEAERRDRKRAG